MGISSPCRPESCRVYTPHLAMRPSSCFCRSLGAHSVSNQCSLAARCAASAAAFAAASACSARLRGGPQSLSASSSRRLCSAHSAASSLRRFSKALRLPRWSPLGKSLHQGTHLLAPVLLRQPTEAFQAQKDAYGMLHNPSNALLHVMPRHCRVDLAYNSRLAMLVYVYV